MNTKEREPTQDELLAMAYADGELAAEARTEFEHRMLTDEKLRREVAELKKLEVLARQTAPPEPMDYEWQQLEKSLTHAGGNLLGFLLAVLGTLGLGGFALFQLFTDEGLGLTAKICFGLLFAGIAVLFLVVLRARLRTMPYDPYTEVKR